MLLGFLGLVFGMGLGFGRFLGGGGSSSVESMDVSSCRARFPETAACAGFLVTMTSTSESLSESLSDSTSRRLDEGPATGCCSLLLEDAVSDKFTSLKARFG